MKCANHSEIEAVSYCRECGKPMCAECERPAFGSVYCAGHAPVMAAAPPELPKTSFQPPPPPYSPYTAPAAPQAGGPSPVLAFILGFLIPGVGAIYNGQYAKGIVHAVIFGVLVSILSKGHGGEVPFVGIFLSIWVFYMAFEAYHTAKRRRMGVQVDEFSALIEMKIRPGSGRFPVGPVILIGLGFILLLDTTDLINLEQLGRFWPVILIVLGIWKLYERLNPPIPADHDPHHDTHQDTHQDTHHDTPGVVR